MAQSRALPSGVLITVFLLSVALPPVSADSLNAYSQTNLVSDLPGVAANTDADLVNPWGIAFGPTSPFWIADNHTGLSTLYNGAGGKLGLVVTIPPPSGGTPPAPVPALSAVTGSSLLPKTAPSPAGRQAPLPVCVRTVPHRALSTKGWPWPTTAQAISSMRRISTTAKSTSSAAACIVQPACLGASLTPVCRLVTRRLVSKTSADTFT
jgi:hypothetical protein